MTQSRVVAKPAMVQKNFRVPADLYAAAMAKADERNETLSDVVREALAKYVRRS